MGAHLSISLSLVGKWWAQKSRQSGRFELDLLDLRRGRLSGRDRQHSIGLESRL
jgi:hypothetical protein